MTLEEREIIRDFSKCDFTNIHHYLKQQAQIRKDRYVPDFVLCVMIVCLLNKPIVTSHDFSYRSKEEKAAEKDRLGVVQDKYGFCMMDGHKQKVANFRYKK